MTNVSVLVTPLRALITAGLGVLLMMITYGAQPVFAEEISGRWIYKNNCALCHKTGLNAAPKYGEDRDWKAILNKGKAKVYENAINGIGAMPPRGGNKDLSDAEVKAAVDYMIGAVGGW